MGLNPYAKYLGARDPVEVIRSTAAELAKLAAHHLHQIERLTATAPLASG